MRLLVLVALTLTLAKGQVDIRQKREDGMMVQDHKKETEQPKEIYTSMHELMAFFEKEKVRKD